MAKSAYFYSIILWLVTSCKVEPSYQKGKPESNPAPEALAGTTRFTDEQILYVFTDDFPDFASLALNTKNKTMKGRRIKGKKIKDQPRQAEREPPPAPEKPATVPVKARQKRSNFVAGTKVKIADSNKLTNPLLVLDSGGNPTVVISVSSGGAATTQILPRIVALELLKRGELDPNIILGDSELGRHFRDILGLSQLIKNADQQRPRAFSNLPLELKTALSLVRLLELQDLPSGISQARAPFAALFDQLDPGDLWRLGMDGKDHNRGEGAFDVRELGYGQAMKQAFLAMYLTMDVPLSADLLETLHDIAVENVRTVADAGYYGKNPPPQKLTKKMIQIQLEYLGLDHKISVEDIFQEFSTNKKLGSITAQGAVEFRTLSDYDPDKLPLSQTIALKRQAFVLWYFRFNPKQRLMTKGIRNKVGVHFVIHGTRQGLIELEHRIEGVLKGFSEVKKEGLFGQVSRLIAKDDKDQDEIRSKINSLVDHYRAAINSATTGNEKMLAIIELVQSLDQLHPFYDGNIRTFGMLLTNRLLVENGLSPTIMKNPNDFDGIDRQSLVGKIKEGQLYWQSLLPADSGK